MFKRYSILFLILFYPSFSISQSVYNLDLSQQKGIFFNNWSYREGDSIIWTSPDYNDNKWQVITRKDIVENTDNIYWLRTKINLSGNLAELDFLQISIINLANAFEVYWDGKIILTNGKIGKSADDEEIGFSFSIKKLKPAEVKEGEHTLAVRVSNFQKIPKSDFGFIAFGYASTRQEAIQSELNQVILFVGGYSIAVLFTFMLFIGNNKYKAYLFLLFSFLLILIFYAKAYFQITVRMPINYFNYLLLSNFLILLAQSIVSVAFILYVFEISWKYLLLLIFAVVVIICNLLGLIFPIIDYHAINLIETIYSIGLLVLPTKKTKPGAKLVLIGYAQLFFLYFYFYLYVINPAFRIIDPNILFLIGLFIFWYCLITAVGQKIKYQNKLYEEFRLHSLRLETDLLRKSIQPHFIINTLASIKSLTKRKPDDADKLINALAAEYRLINKISSEKEIPISQEIELCESHLELMGYRLEAKYELIKQNIDYSLKVPPLVFHTLIENGLTHAFKPKEDGKFWLTFNRANNFIEYKLLNNGSLLQEKQNQDENEIEEGTGVKYIKARLEESYPGKWQLNYGLKDNLWEVVIKITG
ncbi:MAG: histidine kinase [Bacteroidota bacterium]